MRTRSLRWAVSSAASLLLLTGCSYLSTLQSLGDARKAFLVAAAQGLEHGVATSQIAIVRTKSDPIEHLAEQILIDHQKALTQLKVLDLAQALYLPKSGSRDQQTVEDRLREVEKESFDSHYLASAVKDLEEMQVALERAGSSSDTSPRDDLSEWINRRKSAVGNLMGAARALAGAAPPPATAPPNVEQQRRK